MARMINGLLHLVLAAVGAWIILKIAGKLSRVYHWDFHQTAFIIAAALLVGTAYNLGLRQSKR